MDRRTFLKTTGIGGATVGGSLLLVGVGLRKRPETLAEGGPPNQRDWTLAFHDRFRGDTLDEEKWGVGWGWGRTTNSSPTRIRPENVAVNDRVLSLRGTHDGSETFSGAVNTKNIVSFGPGSYVEARIKFAKREGFLNAFWAKPVSERWPPEIDVVELFQEGNRPDEVERAHHHLHYSRSGEPSDETTYEDVQATSTPGGDLTTAYHTYGLEWREDRVVPYVDGVAVHEWTDETILRALAAGGPFYLMLSLNIDKLGTPDRSESWGETMLVDWVRLWEHRG
jgi:beta-glucanase (GH16 family)